MKVISFFYSRKPFDRSLQTTISTTFGNIYISHKCSEVDNLTDGLDIKPNHPSESLMNCHPAHFNDDQRERERRKVDRRHNPDFQYFGYED